MCIRDRALASLLDCISSTRKLASRIAPSLAQRPEVGRLGRLVWAHASPLPTVAQWLVFPWATLNGMVGLPCRSCSTLWRWAASRYSCRPLIAMCSVLGDSGVRTGHRLCRVRCRQVVGECLLPCVTWTFSPGFGNRWYLPQTPLRQMLTITRTISNGMDGVVCE